MKQKLLLLEALAYVLLTSSALEAQLNGTKTIDPAGSGADNYITFAAAISDLNTNGTTTGVTFLIASGTYTEAQMAIVITQNLPSATAPVVFKPAPGATVVLNLNGQVTGNRFGLRIGTAGATSNADYVTLDGSNANGGTTRDWTITASDASYGLEPIDIWADNVTIKNCVISCYAGLMSGSSYGITIREAAPTALNCRIENNKVTSNNAISVGRATTITISGTIVKDNEVHSFNRGIYAYSVSDITVQNNEIVGDAYAGYPTGTCYGVYTFGPANNTGSIVISGNTLHNFGSNSGTTASQTIHVVAAYGCAYYTISNNKIYNLYNATTNATTAVALHGIYLSGGTTNVSRYEVFNNFITGFFDNDPDAGSNWTAGIRANTPGRVNVYNNSVYLAGTVRNHYCAAFICGGNTALDSVFTTNNIFWNNSPGTASYKSQAIYKGGSALGPLVSDYNCLYNDGGTSYAYLGAGGGDWIDFAGWQTTGNDAHSCSKAVSFVDSSSNLHLMGPSMGDASLTGTPNVGWTVSTLPPDIDGSTRNAKYPYKGADEATAALAAVGVSLNSLDFGNVFLKDSLSKTVYIKSVTKNAITVTGISVPASDFTWQLTTPSVVSDSVALDVKFKPHALGSYSDVITITSDFGTATVTLSGNAPPQPLSGAYTINGSLATSGTNFQTFGEACNALTINGVTGPVTFSIASGTYVEAGPLTINPTADKPASDKGITFAVASGATVSLNITATVGQFAFTIGSNAPNSVDYVTLNGSNSSGTDRSWTIHTVGPDSSQGILVFGDNVQIKNIIVTLDNPWSNAPGQGIVLHQTGSSDNCIIENCDVTANYAILIATSSGTTQTGNIIRNNTVHCLARGIVANQSSDITIRDNTVIGNSTIYPLVTGYGIYASNSATTSGTVIIEGNIIHDLGTNSGTTPAVTISGIYAGSKGASYLINRNKVYNIYNATSNATTNVQVQGITLSNGDNSSQMVISNNFIYGLKNNDADENSNWTAGIRPITAGKVYVYYNTVYIENTARAHYVAAFICGGGVNANDTNFVFNNILYCRQTGFSSGKKSYSIYKGGSFLGTLVSDYNLLYNDGGGANSAIGSPSGATFAAWQASGRDPHSSSKYLTFVDTTSDYHLTGATLGDGALAALPMSNVTVDFDGETRSVVYPYMGADESTVPLAGISVSQTAIAFGNVGVADSVIKTVHIMPMNKNGIIITAITAPASDFSWEFAVPDTVADSAAVVVKFKPHAIGTYADTIKITSNVGSTSVNLSGASPAAVLVASAQALAFGSIKVDSFAVQTVTITNNSVNRLVIDSIYTRTPQFLVDRPSANILSDTLSLQIAFMPTAPGTYADTVFLKSNGVTSLVKISLSGVGSPATGVNNLEAEVPHVFSLKQNYPNPFNPSTKILFTVPSNGYATLRVFNVLGQPVATLYDGLADAGKIYQRTFSGARLATGIYFARLEFGSQVAMQKMLLMK